MRGHIVNIAASSASELSMRITELEKRGYKVTKRCPVERPEYLETSYDSTKRGATRARTSYLGFEKHRVVMERGVVEVE